MKIDFETRESTKEPALAGSCEEIAATVRGTLPGLGDMGGLESMLVFAGQTELFSEWLEGSGTTEPRRRNMFRNDSPVKSSRFL